MTGVSTFKVYYPKIETEREREREIPIVISVSSYGSEKGRVATTASHGVYAVVEKS